jgi:hypothetical protein
MISANQSPTVVTITSPGPQGPQGPAGPPGGATTGSNTFTGNQTITGSILISGSIIPAVGTGETTSSFSLGSETAAWKDIYVSEGSIKFIKSGSAIVTLSAANGGISVDGGSVISEDGVSGQFITSKSLNTNTTVKDSNNSLLMGPIDVETDKEIVVEEGSDLTIFGDIEIQNVATADTALFSTSASYADSSSYASSSSYSDTSSYAAIASYSDTSSYAVTASYVLNATTSSTFPYSGSAVITGSLIVNNGTNNIVDTSNYQLLDSNGAASIDWQNKVLKLAENRDTVDWGGARLNDYSNEALSVDWEGRILYDTSANQSIDWQSRIFYANDGATAHIDWSNPSYISFPNVSTSPITNILGIDGSGRIYYTASNAIGGGTNTPAFPYTGSAGITGSLIVTGPTTISGSLVVTGSTTSTLGFTGSLLGTAATSSYLNTGTGQIFDPQAGLTTFQAARIALTASNVMTLGALNGVNFESSANFSSFTRIQDLNTSGGRFVVDPIGTPPTHTGTTGQILPFQSGSVYRIYVYLGGQWRSASLF